ncbi:MAG: hypothetical protein E7Z92_01545 [Cyanobacteria bacterium SIG31]|nr:hypothetical protein [Cyanobacteria bacterium SIG31]
MNINAISSSMMNQNLKLKMANAPQEPETKPVSYATKPEVETTSPAFQGLNMTQLSSGAKKGIMALAAAAALTMGTTSCSDEIIYLEPNNPHDIIVNVYVEDKDNMSALIEMMMKYFEERDEKLFNMLSQWMTEWQNGRMEDQALLEKMYNLMLTNNDNQNIIIDLLKQNGKSDEEAKAFLEKLLAEVQAGNMTAAEAYKQIMEELGDINITLKEGLNKLFEYMQNRDDKLFKTMLEWKEQYDNNEMSKADFSAKMLDAILANQEKIINLLVEQGMSEAEAKAYLEKIVSQLNDVNGKLDYIIEQLKYISGQITENADKQDKRWNQFLEMAANYKGDIEALKDANELSNDYLKLLIDNTNDLKATLKYYMEQNGEGMTLDDLKKLLGEESEAWKEFIAAQFALYLDGVKGDVTTIKDYISMIEEKMATKEDLQAQGNRLEQLLAKIDWNTAETLGVAQEIRDLIAQGCDCKCAEELKKIVDLIEKLVQDNGNNNDNNEGILGDL